MSAILLDIDKVIQTIGTLEQRILERFPNSSLSSICNQLLMVAKKNKANIDWIDKPNILLRSGLIVLVCIGLAGLIYSITLIDFSLRDTNFTNIISLSEALFNDLILIGAAIFFLVTIETKIKRNRVLKSLNELRAMAHVIDMHQLTKDPSMVNSTHEVTRNSPKRPLSKFELQRYLEYCSEAFSLIGKVAAMYSQSLPDEVIVKSVNEIEVLSTGLSRKVWQKLIILNELSQENTSSNT